MAIAQANVQTLSKAMQEKLPKGSKVLAVQQKAIAGVTYTFVKYMDKQDVRSVTMDEQNRIIEEKDIPAAPPLSEPRDFPHGLGDISPSLASRFLFVIEILVV
jgi:hypothetical protein